MWASAAEWCRPGGRLVNVGVTGFGSLAVRAPGKYGVYIKNVEEIEGGVRYSVCWNTDPEFEFECTTMLQSARLERGLHERFGFGDLKVFRPEDVGFVRDDPGFWKEFIEEPPWVVLTLRKLGETVA